MPRKLIKKYLPHPDEIKGHKLASLFGTLLHDHNLWHVHRHSTRGAFAVGAFAALMPIPFQTVLAVALAIFFRVNIPIAFAMCWLTNPFTMAPIFYVCYNIGSWILDKQAQVVEFHASFEWLLDSIGSFGEAFLVGSLVFASLCSLFLFFAVDAIWRVVIIRAWRQRQKRYALKAQERKVQENKAQE